MLSVVMLNAVMLSAVVPKLRAQVVSIRKNSYLLIVSVLGPFVSYEEGKVLLIWTLKLFFTAGIYSD